MRVLFLLSFLVSFLLRDSFCTGKNSHLGPQVDQGVFVITHIQSCRRGSGYCILGFSCEIDNDFEPDDLGGHCRGLSAAFNPVASFVCCKEKPANTELQEAIEALNNGELVKFNFTSSTTSSTTTSSTTMSSTTTSSTTMSSTTKSSTTTSSTTMSSTTTSSTTMSSTTTSSTTMSSTTSTLPPTTTSPALEEDMTISVVNSKLDFETDSTTPAIITSTSQAMLLSEETTVQIGELIGSNEEEEEEEILTITTTSTLSSTLTVSSSTTPNAPVDTSTESPIEASTTSSSSTNNPLERRLVSNDKCGALGGQAVIQAFGRAAANLLPDLVASWVTGKTSSGESARRGVNDEDEAKVTSTVIYCWLTAIVELSTNKLICTGTLVQRDVVITTASCANKIITNGIGKYKVAAGDSNLMVNLPFGVQERSIKRAVVHPDFGLLTKENDIGVIQFESQMDLTDTVCLLCLPSSQKLSYRDSNCTITGYGRSIRNEIPTEITDGILRTTKLSILDTDECNRNASPNSEVTNSYRSLEGTICLGEKRRQDTVVKDTCFIALDTGSPLFCQNREGFFELSGVLSSGTTCSKDQSIFVDVSKYLNWILNLL